MTAGKASHSNIPQNYFIFHTKPLVRKPIYLLRLYLSAKTNLSSAQNRLQFKLRKPIYHFRLPVAA